MANSIEARIHRISELEHKCRDALQYDSVFKKLKSKTGSYEKICALLDFIGDSEGALLSVTSPALRKAIEAYFLAYGLLQTMYSRQVALRDVLASLKLSIPEALKKSALVTARDSVIGHPIENNGAAHVIVRHSLNENGFEYWSYYPDETRRGQFVNYETLMEAHLDGMTIGMEMLFRHIAKFENERRRKMRNEPLSQILQRIKYPASQIYAALVEEKYQPHFNLNAKALLSALDHFRVGLAKRFGENRTAYDVDHVIEGIRLLQSFFPPKDTDEANRYRIVAAGVEVELKSLMEIAADIDDQEKNDLT